MSASYLGEEADSMSTSLDDDRQPQRQLGQLMVDNGLLTEAELVTALAMQREVNRPIGQIVVELGYASGAAVANALAAQSGGALRTEYGFALGLPATSGVLAEVAEPSKSATDMCVQGSSSAPRLPRLRLASIPDGSRSRAADDTKPVESRCRTDAVIAAAVDPAVVVGLESTPAAEREGMRAVADERDQAVAELARLEHDLEEVRAVGAQLPVLEDELERLRVERLALVEERDRLAAELVEARGEVEAVLAAAVDPAVVVGLESTLAAEREGVRAVADERDQAVAELARLERDVQAAQYKSAEITSMTASAFARESVLPDEHVLFVGTNKGYVLLRRRGRIPGVGERIEVRLPDDSYGRYYSVLKCGRSPLPERAPCIYLGSS